jgi:hypothetical protein
MAETKFDIDVNKIASGITLYINVTGQEEFKAAMEEFTETVKAAAEKLPLGVEITINGPEFKPRCRPGSDGAPPVASDVNDPGFDWGFAPHLKIMLDGQEVDEVIAYDTEEGWVEHYSGLIEGGLKGKMRSTGDVTVEWKNL